MALKEQINNDIKTALLGGNRFAGEVLRNLKAAILNEEVAQDKRDEGLKDEEIEKIIAREVKKRRESIALYVQGNRKDLADNEEAEIAVIETYLPEQISKEEIEKVVTEVISETGASDIKAMGQVMGAVKAKLGNGADGALVAQIVKQKLG